jgi:hypothetical protein
LPKAGLIAALVNPKNPLANTQVSEIEEAARIIDTPITIVHATNPTELNFAFDTLHEQQVEGLDARGRGDEALSLQANRSSN